MAKENMHAQNAEHAESQPQSQAGEESGYAKGLLKEEEGGNASDEAEDLAAALSAEVKTFQEEARQNYDKYMRAMAEMDNLRRRSEKEKREAHQFALESFFKSLVPVLDSFDQALAGVNQEASQKNGQSSDFTAILAGVTLVHKQLMAVLGQQGFEAVESVGVKFDPNLHQAIQKVESEEAGGETVDAEYSKGYTLHGRLIRPAMVRVLMPKEG